MPRLLAAALIVAMAPGPVLAQEMIPMRVPPGVPASPTTPMRGITVNGSATARLPATKARVELALVTADRKLSLDAAALQPIVDALYKAGADPQSVHLPPNFAAPGYSNAASITAAFSNPTVVQMQSGIISIGTVVSAQKDLVLNSAQVQLSAANCASAIDAVRHDAVHNARMKAESLASDLGVRVGPAIDVKSFDQVAADGSCSWQYYLSGMGGFNPQAPQTPNDYVTVPITATVSITYAIK